MSRRFKMIRRDVWLWRWGIQDLYYPNRLVGTYLTRRGAERAIRARTWKVVE